MGDGQRTTRRSAPRAPRPAGAATAVLLAISAALGILAAPQPSAAESLADVASSAQKSFWAANYRATAEQLVRLSHDFGVENASLYYNLGVTYAKSENLGRAVHAFRRAQKLAPDASLAADIAANLAIVRDQLLERYRKELPEAQFVFAEAEGFGYQVFHLVSNSTSRWVFAAGWALFFLGFAAYRAELVPRTQQLRLALTLIGLGTVLAGGFAMGAAITARDTTLGVVVSRSAELRDGRHPDAPASPLPEGLEVRVMDQSDREWLRIELSNGRVGWASRTDVSII